MTKAEQASIEIQKMVAKVGQAVLNDAIIEITMATDAINQITECLLSK